MKSKLFFMVLCIIMIICAFPSTAYADMGPKPSVELTFEEMGNDVYYITLLSKENSTGPYSVSKEEIDENSFLVGDNKQDDMAVWQVLREYKDKDGFYFIEYFKRCNDENSFKWGYFPPKTFKVLVYFPKTDTFAVSGIYERYAFDSYYTVRLSDDNAGLLVEKSYNYSSEIVGFTARLMATLLIEIIIALLFGLRRKNILIFIVVVNAITQVILNVLLNFTNHNYGGLMFVFNYIWMELLIIIIETVVYSRYFKKASAITTIKKWIAPAYAIASNTLSFAAGIFISNLIPGIF